MIVGLIALLYGCCSHSGDAVFVNPTGDAVITSREVIIDELGRLPTVTFPSGAKIEGLEENTLTPGIVVTIVEQKTTAQNTAFFSSSETARMYLYKITAFMNPSAPVGNKTYVTTTEKPLRITLPRPQDSDGVVLAGVKESDSDPWRFFNFSDPNDIIAKIAGVRAAGANLDDSTFSVFRLGIQLALVSYGGDKWDRLPESYVTSLNATSTASIYVKDGKYLEDLTIKGLLKGVKLDSIKPTDLRARITYRNSRLDNASLKINGTDVSQTAKIDKTVPGYSYQHYFVVDSVSDPAIMGTEGEFAFTLNLSGIETKDFASGFLIEFFNRIDSDQVLPYNYTEFYKFETVEKQDEPEPEPEPEPVIETYTITYHLDNGDADNPTSYDITSATITLNPPTKKGYTFVGWSGTEIDGIASDVTILHGSTGNREYTANWSINSYRLDLIAGAGINTVTGDGMHEYDSSVTASCTMLDGYEFANWSGDFTTETFNMPATNATMTANTKPIVYNIAYELNGVNVAEDNPTNYDVTSATITLHNPAKTGYSFIGWSGTDLTGNENMTVSIAQGSTGDRVYTANYNLLVYNIAYDLGVGELESGQNNPTTYDITSATITLNNPVQDGYTFKGWSGTGLDGDSNTTVTIARGSIGHRSYTANYTPISYIIDYDLAEGHLETGVSNPTTYDITSATITISNPTRDGFNFLGWEGTDITEGTASDSLTIPVGSTGYRSYVASWTPAIVEVYNFTLAEGVTLEMRRCPAGTFTMGCPTTEVGYQSWNGEGTQHEVTISDDFYMGKFEVTQDQYFAVMGTNPSSFREGAANNVRPTTSANYPVEQVSWNDIMTATTGFIDKINTQLATQIPTGYRFDLPTEAQWEYACRAGTTTALNNGKNLINASALDSNLSEVGWYCQNWGQSNNKTHSVGALASNTFGLYDMHGNVFEWCKDWYASDYYTTAPATDPQGPDTGSDRVMRGGSWNNNPNNCRSAYRNNNNPTNRNNNCGFRVALIQIQIWTDVIIEYDAFPDLGSYVLSRQNS